MGLSTVPREIEVQQMALIGDKEVAQSMPQWLGLSAFAKEKKRVPA